MHLAAYYLFSACVLIWLAAFSGSVLLSLALGWIASSFLIVGIAYLLNRPGIFRKRADGSIPSFIRVFFVPFMMGSRLVNWINRRIDRVPAVQKVDAHLYLASRLTRTDVESLKHENIQAILDVTCEFAGLDWSKEEGDFEYLNVPILDQSIPSPAQINQAISWVHQQVRRNRSVVIHCALGRGRSVMIMAAYLLRRFPEMTSREIQDRIRTSRETANMNKRQLGVLDQYHRAGYLKHETQMALIANPVSGRKAWPVNKELIERRLSPFFNLKVYETTKDLSATMFARQALDDGAEILVACGGDGTIAEVADCIAGTDATLGIIPFGTANALSHVLYGISTKFIPVDSACDILIEGSRRKIDTARTNGRLMLLMTGIGFVRQMIEDANRGEKNDHGQLAYIRGFMTAISENKLMNLSISLDGSEMLELTVSSLVVANAAPFSSLLAQGRGEPVFTDGLLDVTWIEAGESIPVGLSIAELVINAATSSNLSGSVQHRQAKHVQIRSDSGIKYAVDGELFEAGEIAVEVQPNSLWVMTTENEEGDLVHENDVT